jgi:prepilin-type N-terminal cleavage/methylation domain-containing protein
MKKLILVNILKNKKAFTLLELLVVVAIIGILSAVGVVAYNGFTKQAKNAAIKYQYKQVVSFLNSEIKKCNLGYTRIFYDIANCQNRFEPSPFGRDIEYSLKPYFNKIGATKDDVARGVGYAVSQGGTLNMTKICSDLMVGEIKFQIYSKSTTGSAPQLHTWTCDVDLNFLENFFLIE